MNKFSLAVALLAFFDAAHCATDAGPSSTVRHFKLQIIESKSVYDMEFTTVGSTSTPLVHGIETTYIAGCEMLSSGPKYRYETLNSGAILDIKPEEGNSDVVTLNWTLVDLVDIQKAKNRGCEVDLPHTKTDVGSDTVDVGVGKSAKFTSDRFTFHLTRID
ncbi:hypothetical protein LPN04_30955 [Rugamonas sp. A1-17]|nr:hypothetical protein [Rugamonas sp. A1-17]